MPRNNKVVIVQVEEYERDILRKTHEDRLNRITAKQLRESREIHKRVQTALLDYNLKKEVNTN
ncbi:hypothetical protein ACOI1C_06320 [Bacillus sp. DJP31]|uniref:hypothetical protein n=1 Tax=Bacillus sp. DJP31 TaxID=3409789 RepID=UPI003BB6DE73